jgi:lipopolysaccharide/colanic/teichoic acid biosynthesis glycosyltransferase
MTNACCFSVLRLLSKEIEVRIKNSVLGHQKGKGALLSFIAPDTMNELTHVLPRVNVSRYFILKRCLDFTLSAILLVLLAPVLLIVALAICFDSPGTPIFRQQRVGAKHRVVNGKVIWEVRPFTVYKFRSMYMNGDTSRHQAFVQSFIRKDYAMMNEIQGQDVTESSMFKLAKDSRITPIGGFLRKTSLDELPQFWNVLIGDMSLVGPRPAISYEVDIYEPWHRRRLEAIPGITGLWQVSARSSVDFDTMVHLDIEYIETQSLWMDLKIIGKTPLVVLRGKGAR